MVEANESYYSVKPVRDGWGQTTSQQHYPAKQSLSALEYSNSIYGLTHPNEVKSHGFKNSRPDVGSSHGSTESKATRNSATNEQLLPPNQKPTRTGVFIHPTYTANHMNSTHHTQHTHIPRHINRKTRNNDVSELFLAEAKAAQARLDMAMEENGSVSSFNTYGATIDQQTFDACSVQNTLTSREDVEPDEVNSKIPFVVLHVTGNTVRLNTTKESKSRTSSSVDYGQQQQYRSYRQPLGLSYALRKTDSGSTFQSLDGLSNSVPLIRHEGKKKQQQNKSSKNKSHRRQRSSSSSSSTSPFIGVNTTFLNCSNTFDANRFACFSSSCIPMDHITKSLDCRHRYASTAYGNICTSKGSTNAFREGPEKASTSTRADLLQLQEQLRDLRRNSNADSNPETLIKKSVKENLQALKKEKINTKTVRFAAPLVTKINYRPYTPQSEIAILYFQEDELEEFECDRETVSGDQFECQYDESALAVHIAYGKINPADE
jgi:hypothetical protein